MTDKPEAEGEFNVVQFFKDGSSEYVRRHVDAETAVVVAHHYCHNGITPAGIEAIRQYPESEWKMPQEKAREWRR
jgi:hypothetical protein